MVTDLQDWYAWVETILSRISTLDHGGIAGRPAVPGEGDCYLATDTGRFYICYVGGVWTDVTLAYLLLAGGTMTGDIAMGGNRVTGLADPAVAQDAATRAYVIAYAAALVHAARHQNGGADEISIAGLDGESVNLAAHRLVKATAAILGHVIVEAGSDIDVDALGKLTLGAHATRHENAGDDEIGVAGLSGLLADDQHVLDAEVLLVAAALVHAARHQNGGADEISVAGLSGLLADDQHVLDAEVLAVAAAKAHEATHVAGGADDIDSALAVAAMANLTTGKIWQGVANRPSEVNIPVSKTIATGTYTGNGANGRQITVGFKCSLVIVMTVEYDWQLVMIPNKVRGHNTASPYHKVCATYSLHAADGFVIGTDSVPNFNENTDVHYYWAISE